MSGWTANGGNGWVNWSVATALAEFEQRMITPVAKLLVSQTSETYRSPNAFERL
jgi:hypothetical protein